MAERVILVSIAEQRLQLREGGRVLMDVAVSTAANGPGERQGSECTPRGWHRIRARIGEGAPLGAVFVGRRPSGEIYTPALRARHPQRDWILTRILWLCGLEPGRNRLGAVDTQRRYVYIHGCPDDDVLGRPGSHGCVKMRNRDVVELFGLAPVGTRVWITEGVLPESAPDSKPTDSG
ncbi:MAG TPA: L,D-transpeptidase [Gammaproteobacteria bacterium]|nr:L,D-transpeptidase [Gammaproteobacteria bacterium]